MTHKTLDNKYDVKILEKTPLPDAENTEKVKLKVASAFHTSEGEKVYEKNFIFKPRHFEGEHPRYRKAIREWIDTITENSESNINIPEGTINTE